MEDLKTFCFGLPGWCHCCIMSEMKEENSTTKPPLVKSLSLKQTRVTNSTNESAKKTKELDERFNSDVTLDQDELSASLAQGSAH